MLCTVVESHVLKVQKKSKLNPTVQGLGHSIPLTKNVIIESLANFDIKIILIRFGAMCSVWVFSWSCETLNCDIEHSVLKYLGTQLIV